MIPRLLIALVILLCTSSALAGTLTTGSPHNPQAVHDVVPAIRHLPQHKAQQIICTALTVYHEARGLGQRAQYAVAFVVRNRADDERFPDSTCAVVWERGKTKHRQVGAFSWTFDRHPNVPKEREAWETAQRIAYLTHMDKEIRDPTNGATHFYEFRKVRPVWSRRGYERIVIEGHVFMKVRKI